MVLQTRIFFLLGDPEKKGGFVLQTHLFQVGEKWYCKLAACFLVGDPEKKWVYTKIPPFLRLQNQFSAALKITSKGAD